MRSFTAVLWSDFAAAALGRDNTITVPDAAVMADNMMEQFYKRFTYREGRWEENLNGPNQQQQPKP